MKSSINRNVPLLFWVAVAIVAVLSLLPGDYLPPIAFSVWDKAQHALGFLVLGALGLWSYPKDSNTVVFGLLIYGAAIEMVQAATGWRYGDWQDWLANAVGVALAYGLWRAVKITNKSSGTTNDKAT